MRFWSRETLFTVILILVLSRYPTGTAEMIVGVAAGGVAIGQSSAAGIREIAVQVANREPIVTPTTPGVVPMDTIPPVLTEPVGGGSGGLKLVIVVAVLLLAVMIVVYRRVNRGDRLATAKQRSEVLSRWGNRCAYRWVTHVRCEGSIQMAHQTSWANGGATRTSNLQPQCLKCNFDQGAENNWSYVLRHGWPVGWLIYTKRWVMAELIRGRR